MPSLTSPQDHSPSTNGCAASGERALHENGSLGTQPRSGKLYWRSLDDLANTPEFREFMHREFPAGAADLLSSSDRRSFLKVMGASLALAGLGLGSGCRRWPDERIAPFAHRPANRTPGVPNYYATMMEIGGVASGLVATSYDGRPIKIDGNPMDPVLRGASDPMIQASVLDLYDPDRSRSPQHQGKAAAWSDFVAWAKPHFASNRNGLAVLSEATSSPTMLAMQQKLMSAFPGAAWFEYEPLNNDNIVSGLQLAFGPPNGGLRPQYKFDQAQTIIALDSDFLHCDGGAASTQWSRDYANGRRVDDPKKQMSRLYAFESCVSLTGANADHRVAVRSADVALVAARLAAAVSPTNAAAIGEIANAPIASADAAKLDAVLKHAIEDLKARGPSIVIAGPRQPAEVHALAALINEALGNVGKTITFTQTPQTTLHVGSLKGLIDSINAGRVQSLIILGGNPVYNAPADLNFADAIKKVANTIHLSDYVDETSKLCTWHINRAHYLEAWGDGRGYDGTITLGQPLIEPLFDGKSAIEVLAAITGDELTDGYAIVRRTFSQQFGGANGEAAWRTALHDGVVKDSATKASQAPRANAQGIGQSLQAMHGNAAKPGNDELEVVFVPDAGLLDGRFANNGWLQELPDPIAKLTWDNAAFMNPATASARGLKTGDMVTIKANGRELKAPVLVLPGQHPQSITIALGYGREFQGRVCAGAGFNAYAIRTSDSMGFVRSASVASAGEHYPLAITQDHYAVDTVGGQGIQERLPTLFREGTLHEYQDHPDFAKHRVHVVHRLSLWEEKFDFHGEGQNAPYAWAMSIDLNACTGCNACVIACQAENNIPVVGKDQVRRGREMHWIRVDRYFKGHDENSPDGFVLSPVTCMHCENAPCEQVCPVAATTHDDQGLNVMVYNRCVGTRYCSNNCPYKVRRFNYFDYHARGPLREQPGVLLQVEPDYYGKPQSGADPLRQMQFNPEVTVRMRGIMEKCTYCVQRISHARIDAKNRWVQAKNVNPNDPNVQDKRVPIEDGSFTTACAQACPTQAIVFGDLNDRKSKVAKLHRDPRTYQMLEELNPKPRTRYMAKIRNPAGHATADSNGHNNSHNGSHG